MTSFARSVSARAWWPLAAFWLLTIGIHFYNWDYGTVRALLLVGIAGLAATGLRAIPAIERLEPRRWLVGVVTLLVVAHVVYCGVRLHRVTHLPDIAATTLAAAQTAAHGENPYTAAIDDAAIAQDGPAYGGYKYLPVMPLVYAPLGLTLGNHGMILTNLLLDLATAALVFVAGRRAGGRAAGLIAAAAYLSLPLVFGVLYAKGVTDLVPVTLLLGGLLANERRPFVAGLLFGLSVSSKLLPGLAALPACIPQRGRGVFGLGFAAGLLPTLLAWLSAPRAFVDNILRFNSIRPVDSSSWLWGLAPQLSEVSRVVFGLLWIGLAVFAALYAARLTTRCSLIVLLLLAIFLGGPAVHQNYNLWWIPFLCVAVAVRTVSAVQAAGSESAIRLEAAGPAPPAAAVPEPSLR